jgi:hypothetical protein
VSIDLSERLVRIAGARTGIAPVNLLDVLSVNGEAYYFSDRAANVATVLASAPEGTGTITPPSVPVLPVPPGQSVAWAYPQNVAAGSTDGPPPPTNGSAEATLTNAILTMNHSAGLANWTWWAKWSNFTAPEIPAGATIRNIYGVVVASLSSGVFDLSAHFNCGTALTPGSISAGGTEFGAEGPYTDLQQSSASVGSVFAGLELSARFFQSLALSGLTTLTISFIGIAVYYDTPTSGVVDESLFVEGGPYRPWLISVPQLSFHRSLQTDTGNFVLQNLSGDTLARDMEKIFRRSTFEGAFFVYRHWQPDAEAPWLEFHGTLTVDDISPEMVQLRASQLIDASQADAPSENFSETCQLEWKSKRCGATGDTECKYSFATCQVTERFMGVLNTYEKNYGQADASVALKTLNRKRKI